MSCLSNTLNCSALVNSILSRLSAAFGVILIPSVYTFTTAALSCALMPVVKNDNAIKLIVNKFFMFCFFSD